MLHGLQDVQKVQKQDPIDIDDDISSETEARAQVQELDGMAKYMHNVRVPTSKTLKLSNFNYRIGWR